MIIAARVFLSITLAVLSLSPVPVVCAQDLPLLSLLPPAGKLVPLSKAQQPVLLRGIKVRPDHPFELSFLMEDGGPKDPVSSDEARRLVAYFLAALTIPKEDLWVNLSPYEKDRIIPEGFATTLMGRDLLAQDYVLKQVAASLMYPEGEAGRTFWSKVYTEARRRFGTEQVPVDTRNKVWILPDKAVVYENAARGAAFVRESSLKVMLEEDYIAVSKNVLKGKGSGPRNSRVSQVAREVIIPLLTKEVNEGANFARLRQVYSALILAVWYRQKIKDSLLNAAYSGQGKTAGIQDVDPKTREMIYNQYLASFKKGVYNYIKEEVDPQSGQTVPRRYFSGGVEFRDMAMTTEGIPLKGGVLEHNTHFTTVEAFLHSRPNDDPIPDKKSSLYTQIERQLEYVYKVIRALRASRQVVPRPVPPFDKVHARIYHQLWDPLTEFLQQNTDNTPNYHRETRAYRRNTWLMRTMLTLISWDIVSEDSLIVPTLRLIADWLRDTPEDPRVKTVRRMINEIAGIHLYNQQFDRSKPTVLFIRGILVGVAATFDKEFKLLEQEYNIAYLEYDEMKPIGQMSSRLNAEIEQYMREYNTRISAAVLYSHGNTVFRNAMRMYAEEHGGEADIFKGMDVIEMAPPLGGSQEAELLKYWPVRVFGARLIMQIQYHLAMAYNPYGPIQQALTQEKFVELYQRTVSGRLVIMPHRDHHNPPTPKDRDSVFFKNFSRLLEGAKIVQIDPANHSTVVLKRSVVETVATHLLSRIESISAHRADWDDAKPWQRADWNAAQPLQPAVNGGVNKGIKVDVKEGVNGGIDFNTDHLDMQGDGTAPALRMGLDPTSPEELSQSLAGLAPVIVRITPKVSPLVFMGVSPQSAVNPAD